MDLDLDYLTPASREQYYALAAAVKQERGCDCLTLGATLSASGGTMWGGPPVMMTTWEVDGYPLIRVEQRNSGERLMYDDSDEWRYWINSDHAWKVRRATPKTQVGTPSSETLSR